MATQQDQNSNTRNGTTQPSNPIIDAPLSPLTVTPLSPDAKNLIPHTSTQSAPTSAVFPHRSPNGGSHDAAAGREQYHNAVDRHGPEGRKEESRSENGSGGWKPKYGRAQSWDQQDWKHALQMGGVVGAGTEKESGGLAGFSENGGGGGGVTQEGRM